MKIMIKSQENVSIITLFLKKYRETSDKNIPLYEFQNYYLSLSIQDKQKILHFYEQQRSHQLLSNLTSHFSFFQFLIEQGFDYNKLGFNLDSLLIFMLKEEKWDFVHFLLDQPLVDIDYAKVNSKGEKIGDTTLGFAVNSGHLPTVEKLYRLGVESTYLNENKIPILLFSLKLDSEKQHFQCFSFLIEKKEIQQQIQNNSSFQHLLCYHSIRKTNQLFLEKIFQHISITESTFSQTLKYLKNDNHQFEENISLFQILYSQQKFNLQLFKKPMNSYFLKI